METRVIPFKRQTRSFLKLLLEVIILLKKTILIVLCLFSLLTSGALAASSENALMSVALYVDTGGHYVPGSELLTKGLNEVIRYKLNLLFLGSEVLSGNEVLRGLSRAGITGGQDATTEALTAYGSSAHVNNVVLLTVRPLSMELDVKAFNTSDNLFIVNKTVSPPDATSLSALDTFPDMIGQQLAELSGLLKS
jgi:hypothetical protein